MTELTTDKKWDLIVVGGGITGAGIFLEAARNGIKTLLIEQNDFAWGTSSRSSKLVHGGLRYLKEKQFALTYESVTEREKLFNEAPFLVKRIKFMMPVYRGKSPSKFSMSLGLTIYDLLAGKWRHSYTKEKFLGDTTGFISRENLKGVFTFEDGLTDDAGLVMRIIKEGIEKGDSTALNYCEVKKIEKINGRFNVSVFDKESLKDLVFNSERVINATGVWCDGISKLPDSRKFIRPLRGSHLVIPKSKTGTESAMGFSHPSDGRMLFVIPWHGVILAGTTDIDHNSDKNSEPKISESETDYILKALNYYFPSADIKREDIISTFAGVRPVVSRGKINASSESREYLLWQENGITSVTGGKLTTFRKIAFDTLKMAGFKSINRKAKLFSQIDIDERIYRLTEDEQTVERLYGRYGSCVNSFLRFSDRKELFDKIPGTDYIWAELVYSAENEYVKKLSDLLLRRLRIGIIMKKGGIDFLDRIEEVTKNHLSWSSERWKMEKEMYIKLWNECYSI